jgi:cell division protease FtsH
MVTEYGMSEVLGPQRLAAAEDEPMRPRDLPASGNVSLEVAAQVDAEVKRLLDHAHATARRLIEDHRGMLDRLAARLIEIETLDEDELAAILDPATRGTA